LSCELKESLRNQEHAHLNLEHAHLNQEHAHLNQEHAHLNQEHAHYYYFAMTQLIEELPDTICRVN